MQSFTRGQGLPMELAAIGHPCSAFEVPGHLNDRRLVGPQLAGFGRVFRSQD